MIAPYISNFYLATYALINYACFHGSLVQATGWRPSFKYYNKWLSFLGAVLCVGAMFLMGWIAAICTTIFIIILYVYLVRKKPDVNWGSSNQAQTYKSALEGMFKLLYTEQHIKNYMPQVLALTGNPVARPAMVDFINSFTKHKGLLIVQIPNITNA
uniref:Amino acid permease/ SLC12A domain-containing protein n=1 Tax=Romanomermis culicivorax TaxID=13658 RepID=A0A915HUT9_ROMCU